MAFQAYVTGSEQNVTANTTAGAVVTTSLGEFSGPYLIAVVVPTDAAGPVSLVRSAAAGALSGIQIPVPTVEGSTVYLGPLGLGDTPYLYAAASTVCRVSLLRVLS